MIYPYRGCQKWHNDARSEEHARVQLQQREATRLCAARLDILVSTLTAWSRSTLARWPAFELCRHAVWWSDVESGFGFRWILILANRTYSMLGTRRYSSAWEVDIRVREERRVGENKRSRSAWDLTCELGTTASTCQCCSACNRFRQIRLQIYSLDKLRWGLCELRKVLGCRCEAKGQFISNFPHLSWC